IDSIAVEESLPAVRARGNRQLFKVEPRSSRDVVMMVGQRLSLLPSTRQIEFLLRFSVVDEIEPEQWRPRIWLLPHEGPEVTRVLGWTGAGVLPTQHEMSQRQAGVRRDGLLSLAERLLRGGELIEIVHQRPSVGSGTH